jgi:diguanylate cyclase (GGDEF)-like protein
MERRKSLNGLQEADQRYWRDVVRFRWAAVGSFFVMTGTGFLPSSMPWFALASIVLIANNVAYTVYRHKNLTYGWYEDAAGYVDIVSISLILISVGTVDHPMWVAYVLVVPAVANFKRPAYNAVFLGFVLACFATDYIVADVVGDGSASPAIAAVIALLLLLTGVNAVMISANNLRLRDVIRIQATTDPLTGLANRRRLFEVLDVRGRESTLLGVMMIDVDDFKTLNDEQGHITADGVLAKLGELLAGIAPERSLAVRYGGDEFVLLTELTSPAEAGRIAEYVVRAGGQRLGIGLSAGVALYPQDAETPEAALQLADCNLRAAKADGKARARFGRAA